MITIAIPCYNSQDYMETAVMSAVSGSDDVEVLIIDGQDYSIKWVSTRVEYNGEDYYLVGLLGYDPIGLFARV